VLVSSEDPDKRIAELERQLAEARAAAAHDWLTPEQVRNVAFGKPPSGERGYDEAEVDAFVDRIEAALRAPLRHSLTPEQVSDVVFAKPRLGKRGYSQREVDAFLDVVGEQLRSEPSGRPPRRAGPPSPTHRSPTRHAADAQTRTGWTADRVVDIVVPVLIVSFVALLPAALPLVFNWVIPDAVWAQLRPILCGAGQHIQIDWTTPSHWYSNTSERAIACVAPDGTPHDVSVAAYLAVLGALYPLSWVAVAVYFFVFRRR
jgi:DivIVA domain-containing protein